MKTEYLRKIQREDEKFINKRTLIENDQIKICDYQQIEEELCDEELQELESIREKQTFVWNVLMLNTVLKKIDQEKYQQCKTAIHAYYQYYAKCLGLTLFELVHKYLNLQAEEYQNLLEDTARNMVKSSLACQAIAEREGIAPTKEQVQDLIWKRIMAKRGGEYAHE